MKIEAAQRLKEKDFHFQIKLEDTPGHYGVSTFTVSAKDKTSAWTTFIKEHKTLLDFTISITLIGG